MRSGHAARRIQIPAAAFDQVVIEQGKNVVRRNPAALRIDDAKAIRIAIGRQPDLRLVRDHSFGEALEVLLGDVGAGALEENIALGANGLVPADAVFLECAIEVAGAAAVQRVVDDARRVLPFQFTETNELAEPRANSSEKKRVSWATSSVERGLRLKMCSAMAATAMRTLPNVKSSAMIPRQPEVPNFMGQGAIWFPPRRIVSWRRDAQQQSAIA